MQEAKIYRSEYNGNEYEVRVSPAVVNDTKGFSASIFSNQRAVGELKVPVISIDEALKGASKIIKAYDGYQGTIMSSVDGKEYSKALGSIKLTWLDTKDVKRTYSEIFDTLDDALVASKGKKHWLLFKLTESSKNNTTWELLPYGKNKVFTRSFAFNNNTLLKGTIVVLSALGIYFAVTKTIELCKTGKLKIA